MIRYEVTLRKALKPSLTVCKHITYIDDDEPELISPDLVFDKLLEFLVELKNDYDFKTNASRLLIRGHEKLSDTGLFRTINSKWRPIQFSYKDSVDVIAAKLREPEPFGATWYWFESDGVQPISKLYFSPSHALKHIKRGAELCHAQTLWVWQANGKVLDSLGYFETPAHAERFRAGMPTSASLVEVTRDAKFGESDDD